MLELRHECADGIETRRGHDDEVRRAAGVVC